MIVKCNDADISQYVSTIKWSGSSSQVSRQLEVSIINSPYDSNIKSLGIKPGYILKLLTDDNTLLIQAMIYNRTRSSDTGTITYKAYDGLNRLIKSNGTYNFKNTTPEKITIKICNEIQMKTGNIIKTNVPIKSMLCENEGLYTIIMKGYTKAYKVNGYKYMPLMIGDKLSVIRRGEIVTDFVLSDKYNIISSKYEEDISNIVNKVKIYNENHVQVGEVKNESSISSYGIFQDSMTKEDGENSVTTAKSMLQGESQTLNVSALGNIACISGYGVRLIDSVTGMDGYFWIESDTHTWSNGTYTMDLELAFKNQMDEQESDN